MLESTMVSCFRLIIRKTSVSKLISSFLVFISVLSVVFFSVALSAENDTNIEIWPELDIEVKQDAEVEARVKKILSSMTLPQKIAQMIQPEIRDVTVEDMRQYGFGSYLNGGGAFPGNNKHAAISDWIDLAEDMYQASIDDSLDGATIPTMWGTDAVHGHNNVIGATLFPHNIGLGAARNPVLIEKIANITATEVMVTGIDWVFAPTVATVRNDRWGRTYESYAEDPEIMQDYAAAIVRGLQGRANKDFLGENRVISTVKHFVGDGGTEQGIDQGNNIASEQVLFDIHAQGYVGGLTAGAQSVMASFNSWHAEKLHGHHYLLTEVLKQKMGFDGFVVGDWNGHGQVAGCHANNCPQAANAGLDIYMVPTDWKALYENTLKQAEEGVISLARIDDAVTRILRVKIRAGLFDKPSPANRTLSGRTDLIGAEAHRKVARQAVRESLVLLKNKVIKSNEIKKGKALLPLNPKLNFLIAGDGANNIGKQSGGWTITWQGTGNSNEDFPGGQSIYDGIREQVLAAGGQVELAEDGNYKNKPDVAIVVFGEEPYAEGQGDRETLEYQPGNKKDLALLKKLKQQGIPVVSIFLSGRPMWVNAELNASDAFVAAWLPGSEGQGIADVILRNKKGKIQHNFKGLLSFSWPNEPTQIVNRHDKPYKPLLPYGFGLRYGDDNILADNLPEELAAPLHTRTGFNILIGGAVNPDLSMQLFSAEQTLEVNANSHSLGSLQYRTTDKEIQEDARRLSIEKGQENAGLRFFSDNILASLNAEMASTHVLKLDFKLYERPTSLFIKMLCQQESVAECAAGVDISQWLSEKALNEWSSLSISLQCFADKGMDLNKTMIPFELVGKNKLDVEIADILIVSGEPNFICH